jgi:hypothetical protein
MAQKGKEFVSADRAEPGDGDQTEDHPGEAGTM